MATTEWLKQFDGVTVKSLTRKIKTDEEILQDQVKRNMTDFIKGKYKRSGK